MLRMWLILFITITSCIALQQSLKSSFRNEKQLHTAKRLSDEEIIRLNDLTNVTNIDEILDNICVVRNVGSPGHDKVRDYIHRSMKDLGWNVDIDHFQSPTPIFGVLEFDNIIATLNPNARRYLALACHYDSKYTEEGNFVGATDSAVPCTQLINLATVMKKQLEPLKTTDVSLMFIFFDGEEAFKSWGPTDSIYGARHLAKKWHNIKRTYGTENDISNLDRMDMLVLLDLIGAPDMYFYSYFDETARWYLQLMQAEEKLSNLTLLQNYPHDLSDPKYFKPYSVSSQVEDDHIPFYSRNVPILHIIPSKFPSFWHRPEDNRSNIDMVTIENLNKILRVFIAAYFALDV
ncbi:glutaminyl-peptide cyclotransferase-like [Chelonus insularis]|uniref:glutaminyl-peptide cyclotransferase-like n=1 Tax=Chelonus insularis TaxID=460826 RepID=UPI001589C1DB|nr:glutaminyl-peptide cyclotransferase-like [Chelonus insularis]